MKRTLILLAVATMFVGCNPCKRLWRECPPEVYHDSVYIETVKLDTLVLIAPADTMYIEVPEVSLADLGIVIDNPDQHITFKVEEGVFTAQVICKEDSLLAVIAEIDRQRHEIETVIKEVEVEVEVKHVPKFWKFTALLALCCVIYIGVGTYAVSYTHLTLPTILLV